MNEFIGWNLPASAHVEGISDERSAVQEAASVVDATVGFHQASTRAHFLLGPALFATVEPRGSMFRTRYARYPISAEALIEKLQGEGVVKTFVEPR